MNPCCRTVFLKLPALWLALCLALSLTACGGHSAYREGMDLLAAGQAEAGLARLEQASREAPGDKVLLQAYRNARQRQLGRWLAEARASRLAGQKEAAQTLYQRALGLDPDNAEAAAGLAAARRALTLAGPLAEARARWSAGDAAGAEALLAPLLAEHPDDPDILALQREMVERAEQAVRAQATPPQMREALRTPVSIEFRDASLKQVLEALSRHSGLNFVLDKEVPAGLAVTVFLRGVSVLDAVELILVTHQLRYRILNDASLLIFPDTAAKLGEHQQLVVRNFFLRHAEAKQVAAMLKSVLKVRNVFADDKLNLLILREPPETVRLAERLVALQDVPEPEVMLEVAVLEVTRSYLSNLGIQFPSQLSLTPLASSGGTLTLRDLGNLSEGRTQATISPLVANIQDEVDAANLLANPRIRTHNREKALIRIGDRVPVVTTTATSTGFISENVQYVDVGLKLEVEPVIYPEDEVLIKLALEVSSVTKEVVSKAGSLSYQIGGRNASTVLRLKDGETQILGGLINDDDRRVANRFPGLGELPLLGRLFSSHKDNAAKSELVLSITPRIVRSLAPPAQQPREFWSGTENLPRLREPLLREGNGQGPGPLP